MPVIVSIKKVVGRVLQTARSSLLKWVWPKFSCAHSYSQPHQTKFPWIHPCSNVHNVTQTTHVCIFNIHQYNITVTILQAQRKRLWHIAAET